MKMRDEPWYNCPRPTLLCHLIVVRAPGQCIIEQAVEVRQGEERFVKNASERHVEIRYKRKDVGVRCAQLQRSCCLQAIVIYRDTVITLFCKCCKAGRDWSLWKDPAKAEGV